MKAREVCSFRSVLFVFVFVNISIIIYFMFKYEILNANVDQSIVRYTNNKNRTFSEQLELSSWSNLAELGDFAQQAKYLVGRVRLSRAEARRCSELIDGLRHQLRKLWPEFKMVPFGSTVNGLALSTGLSDIDVRVIFQQANSTLFKPSDLVIQAAEVIRQNKSYSITRVIPDARVPLVRLSHTLTGYSFDVSFEQPCNSEIIKYLFDIDRRALYLMIIVKYWAKVNKLQISPHTSSTVWYLIVLFYLQHENILPPAYILQKCAGTKIFECWNFAFEEPYEYLYQSEINTPLYKLLGGFFAYYAKFDFQQFCISVYNGSPILRRSFDSVETLPGVFQLYKHNIKHNITSPLIVNSALCIQDIFIHNLNTAEHVNPEFLNKLLNSFQQATNIFRTHRKKDFLSKLFTAKILN